jgi:membrane protease subunit HflK
MTVQSKSNRTTIVTVLGIAVAVWQGTGLYKVRSEQRAVVQRFGRVVDLREGGLHWTMPWPMGRVTVVASDEVRSVQLGLSQVELVTGRRASDPRTQYLSADQGLVQMLVRAQYTVRDERDFLFAVTPDEAERMVTAAVESALTALAGQHRWDALLKDPVLKSRIFVQAREQAQHHLNIYDCGIRLKAVSLVALQPPGAVAGAFNDVLSAQSEANESVRQAESEAEQAVQTARARATEVRLEARAYANRQIELAGAERDDFPRRAAAYRAAPATAARLMFLESMRAVLPKARKVIVPTAAGNQKLDLSIVEP